MKIEVNRELTDKQNTQSLSFVFVIVFILFSIWFINVWGHDFKRCFYEGREYERFEIVRMNGTQYVVIKYEDESTNENYNVENLAHVSNAGLIKEGSKFTKEQRTGKVGLIFYLIVHTLCCFVISLLISLLFHGAFIKFYHQPKNIVKGQI